MIAGAGCCSSRGRRSFTKRGGGCCSFFFFLFNEWRAAATAAAGSAAWVVPSSQPARGGKGHLHATAGLGRNRQCDWGGGAAASGFWAQSGVGEDTPRSAYLLSPQAMGRGSERTPTGTLLLFKISGAWGRRGQGPSSRFCQKLRKCLCLFQRTVGWGLLSESGSLSKCRPLLLPFLGCGQYLGRGLFRLQYPPGRFCPLSLRPGPHLSTPPLSRPRVMSAVPRASARPLLPWLGAPFTTRALVVFQS